MKKRILTAGILLWILCIFAACGFRQGAADAEALGIALTGAREQSSYDTHSGNGDGVSCVSYSFSDSAVEKQLRTNPAWKPLPLDETTRALLYGRTSEDGSVSDGPYLTDDAGNPLVPELQTGYYCLLDRQAETRQAETPDLLKRPSFNLTIGLYDAETKTLYLCKLDT